MLYRPRNVTTAEPGRHAVEDHFAHTSQRACLVAGSHDTIVIVDTCAVMLNVLSTNLREKPQSAIFGKETQQMGTQQAALGREQLAI